MELGVALPWLLSLTASQPWADREDLTDPCKRSGTSRRRDDGNAASKNEAAAKVVEATGSGA